MEILNIIALCMVSIFVVSILKRTQKEIGLAVAVIVGILIFLMLIDKLVYVVEKIVEMSNRVSFASGYVKTLIKMTGIALVSEYTASVCKDSGESAIAEKVEFAGKIIILFLSLPLIMSLFDLITKFLR
ncbi:stage III sporulation protein AD [Caldicellulosiruptor owensensis OL]|uniref:Stage III sporulation protein AD n=1 Tax=Caldicellulosiruptor owensensis (strain ATCC 700167 / DSM 13100 / OL) TaxID=632518 RepID=E4Q5X3_CALOW|nr:stage III sporulation protein AD [Caldicellulosiruptor owensensis]ADQ04347.1 stage III sporulation protein AD [Caldicellulosiruptor owensensis OL]